MGFFSSLRFAATAPRATDRLTAGITAAIASTVDPSTYPIASPWSTSDLQRIVFEDIYGTEIPQNTRSAAMALPPIARGRNRVVSAICKQPMVVKVNAGPNAEDAIAESQPSWLTKTGDGSAWQVRNAWTVDDLIFYGWSCWSRGNLPSGELDAAHRINQGDWSINLDGKIEVNGTVAGPREVILIPGIHEGILTFGRITLEDARKLYAAVRQRLSSPLPGVDLHQTGGEALLDEEIDALIARWVAARNGKYGGVGYTSENIEAKPIAAGDETLMLGARNAIAVDLARVIGISAAGIDATNASASLTYETTQGRNQEFLDFDLDTYATPFTARLSMDDVTRAGTYVALDLSAFVTQAPSVTGPDLQD